MDTAYTMTLDALVRDISANFDISLLPLNTNAWVASSLLQKAIRRSETELAQRAALTLLQQRPSTLWRRLQTVAYEDVGIGSPEVVSASVALCHAPKERDRMGGDAATALAITRLLAEAPKDRSADYLICSVYRHPDLEDMRERSGCCSQSERLQMIGDPSLSLVEQAVALWHASGQEWAGASRMDRPAWTEAVLQRLHELGVPESLICPTRKATQQTKSAFFLMALLAYIHSKGEPNKTVEMTSVPDSPICGSIPLYAYDKHTRQGKQAIWAFAQANVEVRDCLAEYVPDYRQRDAVCTAVFYADAMPIHRRLMWSQSEALERWGMESDLARDGVAREGIPELVQTVRKHLGRLNSVRMQYATPASG